MNKFNKIIQKIMEEELKYKPIPKDITYKEFKEMIIENDWSSTTPHILFGINDSWVNITDEYIGVDIFWEIFQKYPELFRIE